MNGIKVPPYEILSGRALFLFCVKRVEGSHRSRHTANFIRHRSHRMVSVWGLSAVAILTSSLCINLRSNLHDTEVIQCFVLKVQ